tara:strand:+ start:18 stop:446 length:429 start_codon:yes stop_codon:yes gene_type:complete
MGTNKQELHDLADGLIIEDPKSIDGCIQFIESNSEGIWHGRARSMMCRRFKHIELSRADADRLLVAILGRFESGRFAEQFRDMLRLALVLDENATNAVARKLSADSRDYVRTQADWILEHHSPEKEAEQDAAGQPATRSESK